MDLTMTSRSAACAFIGFFLGGVVDVSAREKTARIIFSSLGLLAYKSYFGDMPLMFVLFPSTNDENRQ